MKKTAVFMAVILFLLSILTGTVVAQFTSAYTPVKPENTQFDHTLTLTDEPYVLDYTFVYSFTVSENPTVVVPVGLPTTVVTGSPKISDVTYGPADTFDPTTGELTKTVTVDWSGVTFSEPGTYYWKVTKAIKDKGGAPQELSNNSEETFLYAYVTDEGVQGLKVITGLSKNVTLKDKTGLDDHYPATTVDLSAGKKVTGTQGSKDQYFKFEISVKPSGSSNRSYNISGFDPADTVNASPYNDSVTQPKSPITLPGGQSTLITVWLKHDQTFKIKNLPYGSSYTVTETAAGYSSTYEVSGDATDDASSKDISRGDGISVSDSSITKSTTVEFTNNKDGEVPTGIALESGAPVMGMILTAGLLALVFAPKRRKENN